MALLAAWLAGAVPRLLHSFWAQRGNFFSLKSGAVMKQLEGDS
jgi:hypothetical protein